MPDTKAIIVGVDNYPFRPLYSAVSDALKLRDELLGKESKLDPLVGDADVTLLLAPHPGENMPKEARAATYEGILGALEGYYNGQLRCDRLVFYFAGHGLVSSRDGRENQSLILPSDVAGIDDGRRMICIDDLLSLFSQRGPREQIWIFDACRDAPYQKRPRGYAIAWPDEPEQTPRAQVAIFAVAPGGKAKAVQGGNGVFTQYLLRGLRGEGSAAEHIPARGHWVTTHSLYEFVKLRADQALSKLDEWTRTVQRPQIAHKGGGWPLRRVTTPSPKALTVTIKPAAAVGDIRVSLEVEDGIVVAGWPPSAPPRIYELRAALLLGAKGWSGVEPEIQSIDLRERNEATINALTTSDLPAPVAATTAASGAASAVTRDRKIDLGVILPLDGVADAGIAAFGINRASRVISSTKLKVETVDLGAKIVLRRVDGERREIIARPGESTVVAAGVWDVLVKLGTETTSTARVVLTKGEHRTIVASPQITPALANILSEDMIYPRERPIAALPSETIGPMQGLVLPTLLPLFALKPFDARNQVLRRFGWLEIPHIDSEPAGWFSIAMVEETEREREALESNGKVGTFEPGKEQAAREGWAALSALRPRSGEYRWASKQGLKIAAGTERHGRGTVLVPVAGSLLSIAAPILEGAITAIGVAIRADGRDDTTIAMFPSPLGNDWQKHGGAVAPGHLARQIALASRGVGLDPKSIGVVNAAIETPLDPILGALSLCAVVAAHRGGGVDDSLHLRKALGSSQWPEMFWSLPDARILVAQSEVPNRRKRTFRRLLNEPHLGQPVLSASLSLLASAALEMGCIEHWSVERRDRMMPGQTFNAIWVDPEEVNNDFV